MRHSFISLFKFNAAFSVFPLIECETTKSEHAFVFQVQVEENEDGASDFSLVVVVVVGLKTLWKDMINSHEKQHQSL